MKKQFLVLLVIFCALTVTVSAQKKSKKSKGDATTDAPATDSKAEEKEWAKKLKTLKPLDYKRLVEEKEQLNTELNNCTNQSAGYKDQVMNKDAEIARLKQELETAKSSANTNSSNIQGNTDAGTTVKSSTGPSKGIVYKVQIGSFKNKDLTKYFNNTKNFSGDVDADGTKKYTIGSFTDYWEAENFKKYLREMGVRDAWIVSYKDGKRVPIKDALEGAL